MVFVILCGGLGTRMTQNTLPKPLTPILASPSLKFALENIALRVKELIFIYAKHLAAFNFEEVVINLFKHTKCTFTCIPFATRGAVETALAGVIQLALPKELPVVFLDNDNVYPASLAALSEPSGPFLGFDVDKSDSTAFSFMQRSEDGVVTAFAEKRRISNDFCTGVYGFASIAQFLRWGRYTLQHGPFPNNEIYMSSLFVNMIAAGERVESVKVPIVALGTASLANSFMSARSDKLRICFDLDNTLVTYPRVPGDYSTVLPVDSTISVARWARAEGHTIIIYTARRMMTHANNVGRVTADIGRVTFDTLEKFNIPYDEIIFGKPIADVYIDDRAVNPFLNSLRALGLPFGDPLDASAGSTLPNALPNNRFNSLRVQDGRVYKRGPASSVQGEVFFYEEVAKLPIVSFFPAYFGRVPVSGKGSEISGAAALPASATQLEFGMEVIKGVPLTTVFRAGLLEDFHLEAAVSALRRFHACDAVPITLPSSHLQSSFGEKLRARFTDMGTYGALPDAPAIMLELEAALSRYVARGPPTVAHVIHGDAWFANILVSPTNALKFVDMRGQVGGVLTLNGDPIADFAKFLQSLLGFDEIVFGLPRVPLEYRARLVRSYASILASFCLDTSVVLDIAVVLIAGTLPFYDDEGVRLGIWDLVRNIVFSKAVNKSWHDLLNILRNPILK